MSEHVYGYIELTGSSTTSSDHAVDVALAKAGEVTDRMRWFEVTDVRGHIVDGKVAHWQVTVKVGYTMA